MRASDYVIDFLAAHGVTHVFEVAGGAITYLLDSVYDRKDIETVSMHHEMAAAIAAEGYARASGGIGAAMATSGPGATNLITGIGSCFFDSVPCIYITGQVNTYEYKFESPVRQIGFQETDIVSIAAPIVKDAVMVTEPGKIRYLLEKAFYTATEGRPGPVLLDMPMNIQRAEIDPERIDSFREGGGIQKVPGASKIKKAAELIRSAERPVILAGGGVRTGKACAELSALTRKTGIPVVTSLMGLDALAHDDPAHTGMIGTYGNRHSNLTLANADLVLALGTRLDTRQTGTAPKTFVRGANIIQVDIDSNSLKNMVHPGFPINSDVRRFLEELNPQLEGYDKTRIRRWQKRIEDYKKRYPVHSKKKNGEGCLIDPKRFLYELSKQTPEDSIICVDVGQVQMWAAQAFEVKKCQRLLTQGGMASIGSALPMAIGASFAKPGKTVLAISGDGGFQLNSQELQTVYHHQLPIKIIILNNCAYGMIRQFQDQYFDSRLQSTGKGYSCPDFEKLASAYKIRSKKIDADSQVEQGIKDLFCDKKPMLLEVGIDPKTNAEPKLSMNRPIEDQDPLVPFEELKANMLIEPLERAEMKQNKNA